MEQKELLHFNGTWRSYQKRILDNLDFHLRDKKLHVVAAPGAGKTTLGIEVIARLGRPTLILCPTNTIKMQWKERICSSFLEEKDYGVVSTLVRQPGYITIITYQALLSAFCGDVEEADEPQEEEEDQAEENKDSIKSSSRFKQEKADEVVALLREAGVSLLCFDEAHHLRKEWWKALTYLNEHLKPEQTLALTATPPYDADMGEWKRYQELCGEIDEVISIPELVKNGDLCPHQDFIFITSLKKSEREMLAQHNEHVRMLIDKIRQDEELLSTLSKMPFFRATDADVEMIFEDPQFYVSIASLLHSRKKRVAQRFLELFDANEEDLPKFDVKMAAAFLDGLYATKEACFAPLETRKEELFNLAKRLGLVANRRIVLNENSKIRKLIAGSLGKFDAIVKIVEMENHQLADKLRMVILTDRIRVDDLDGTAIGVVPIWKKLTDLFGAKIPIGVLCGSLILLPKRVVGQLQKLLTDNRIDVESLSLSPFKDFADYVRVVPKENVQNQIVRLVTEMFNAGDVNILIGTQALLGEGWDAPSINSLVLSSTVSSYMLSNQMRGRAIRIDRNNPDKVSNIWHLATFELPTRSEIVSNSEEDKENLRLYLQDMDQLAVRFEGFEAPAYEDKHEIKSGIRRVIDLTDMSFHPLSEAENKAYVAKQQNLTMALAADRAQTRRWWKEALCLGYDNEKQAGLHTGVQVRTLVAKTMQYKSNLVKIYLYSGILGPLFLRYYRVSQLDNALSHFQHVQQYRMSHLYLVGVIVVFLLLVREVVRYLRYGTVAGIMKQVSIVLLEALSAQGAIKSSLKIVGLQVENEKGEVFIRCTNLPVEENNLFMNCLQEFLDPIDNPRYLLVKHDVFQKFFKQKDYFAIPAVLSANKESVKTFQLLWERYIGKCDVVYTRNLEGRKVLLRARRDASSASKRESSKRLSKWQ